MRFRKLILYFFFLFSIPLWATHNRAGDITYVQIGLLKIRMTVTTYTKTSSVGADRDSIDVFWGDGQKMSVQRVNGPQRKGEPLENDVKKNLYVAEHTYPGIGTYIITMTDPNRVGNILNLNYPNSVGVQFHLATSLTLLNSTLQGYNNSVVLLQPPLDFGCVGKKFVHNINAYDPDGDSITYELIVPFQATGSEVPSYRFPDQITPGPDNKISLDKNTGNFVWLSPQREGEYNVAFLIKEYRNGILLNTVIRDMQITIENCSNDPPELTIPNDICVVAGQKIEFTVSAVDKNVNQKIAITALGGPFNQAVNKALFTRPNGFQTQPATGTFTWQTSCEHISDIPYTIVFRAVDNFRDTTGLADLKSIRIKVVGPAPENVRVESTSSTQVKVSWTFPTTCAVTTNNYFKGFALWRKINSTQITIDTCRPSLAGKGYVKIASNINAKENDRFFYNDDMLDGGHTYCYRVVAEFAFTSPGGNSFNRVAGLPSEEKCIQLKRDLPFITKVSVLSTSTSTGKMQIQWVLPFAQDLDTIKNKGPYKINLLRAEGFFNANTVFTQIPGASFSSVSFSGLQDTAFVDSLINTGTKPYSYKLEFFAGNLLTPLTSSLAASSVLLSTRISDRAIHLSWDKNVPWTNTSYEIYRSSAGGTFVLIGTSNTQSYTDRPLLNGTSYCYKIQAIGSYGIPGLPVPLTNFSQESCAIPQDISPPCMPLLTIERDCAVKDNNGQVLNIINWKIEGTDTCFVDDIKEIVIYFRKNNTETLTKLTSISNLATTSFKHTPDSGYTGCYVVTAVDKNNNESRKIGEICPTPCQLEYQLPNVFTPNGDGANDLYTPLTNSGVIAVKFEVFNRWGELLFNTENPTINWDGKDSSGKLLNDGVYYYKCIVQGFNQNNTTAIEERKGFIQIIKQ